MHKRAVDVQCGPGNGRQTPGGGGTKVSHAGWPAITGELLIVTGAGRRVVGSALNDEILGGHGSDTLIGVAGRDVLWGDANPTGNTPHQHDVLWGGPGNDFIYPSHGLNAVYAGPGRDIVRAYYGHGTIDCGPGYDIAQVNENHAYILKNCEHVVHFCAFGSAADGHCLRPGEPGAKTRGVTAHAAASSGLRMLHYGP